MNLNTDESVGSPCLQDESLQLQNCWTSSDRTCNQPPYMRRVWDELLDSSLLIRYRLRGQVRVRGHTWSLDFRPWLQTNWERTELKIACGDAGIVMISWLDQKPLPLSVCLATLLTSSWGNFSMHAAERYLELCFLFFQWAVWIIFFFLSAQGHLPHLNLRNEGKQLRALTYLHQTGWLVLVEVHWYRNTADFKIF